MSKLEEGQIQIHTENIFPIIKKAVYSDHEIFLRELISNAVDAISKRRMASISGDCSAGEDGKVNISVIKDDKKIIISDNGIGMTKDEIKKYINQVAFSSAEEFLNKYNSESNEIIGHFGLGFYSSFMVSEKVEIITKSAQKDSQAISWECDGSPKFKISEVEKDEVGTQIILHLLEEEIEFLELSRLKNLINKYCDFMPVEIALENEVVNKKDSPWKKPASKLSDKDYIDLYHYLYPFQGDPLLWVHLNTDYPYSLQGILYFPQLTGRADWENGEIKLYCNQVFVSDSIKEIVPRFLLPLRGVIDSPDIPLNVSRSALQTDRRVRSIGSFIAKKVADRLKDLKTNEPRKYCEYWQSIGAFIKIGAMEDDKFSEQVENLILFETTTNLPAEGSPNPTELTDGKVIFTTISDYLTEIDSEQNKKVIYTTDPISQAGALTLWQDQGKKIIKADSLIDTQFIPWLENRKEDVSFVRVDSELDDSIQPKNNEIANKDGSTKSDKIKEIIEKSIENSNVTVKVQELSTNGAPPAIILLPEQMRRISDMGALMNQNLPGLPQNHILLVNPSHPLVDGLLKLNTGTLILDENSTNTNKKLVNDLAKHIYDLAKLGIGGLQATEIEQFRLNTAVVMGALMAKAQI